MIPLFSQVWMDYDYLDRFRKIWKVLLSQNQDVAKKLVKCQNEGVYLYLDNKHHNITTSRHGAAKRIHV